MAGISIDTVKDAIINELRKDSELMLLLKDQSLDPIDGNIYKDWISELPQDLITWPCLTIINDGGRENKFQIGENVYLRIDAWSNQGTSRAQKVLDLAHKRINKVQLKYKDIFIASIIKTASNEEYQTENFKSHAYNRYKLQVT